MIVIYFMKKSFKSDYIKSVKHQEKIDGYYCKKFILSMHIYVEISHLSSDEHKNKNNKVCCEFCGKYISDKTRHFQSEIHLRIIQNNFSLETQSASGTQQSSVQSASGTQQPSVQFGNNVD